MLLIQSAVVTCQNSDLSCRLYFMISLLVWSFLKLCLIRITEEEIFLVLWLTSFVSVSENANNIMCLMYNVKMF